MRRMRAPNRRRRRLGQTEVAGFARFDEVCHRADGLLDRDLRIDAMLIVEIDDVDLQPLQTRVALLEDILSIAAHAEKLVVRTAHIAELRCDHHVLAPAGYRFSDQLLVAAVAVHAGGNFLDTADMYGNGRNEE